MCGIAGIVSRNPELLRRISEMNRVQAHRGPDGEGHLFLGRVARLAAGGAQSVSSDDFLALGHRRLAILDCTSTGAQPMSSQDGHDWISYNGEVYNYLELRRELEAQGHAFVGGSDTEVVLAAYRAWGTECFQKFNGMWAMAIWDGLRHSLILSRDRLGVKPLYYAKVDEALVFASEIKGILATAVVTPKIEVSVALDYLKWAMVGHRQESFFAGIKSFPPGCYAVIEGGEAAEPRPRSFWQLTPSLPPAGIGIHDASQEFSELFHDAVSLRMRSDVPVGSCLSGGLDSSAIVCTAHALLPKGRASFHTFTAASTDPRFDERHWAELVNHQIGAVAHSVFPTGEGFDHDLQAMIWHQEEPFTSASIYAQWRVMQEAAGAGIPVLLDGQGADEGLCGYRKFYLFYLRRLWQEGHIGRAAKELFWLLLQGDRGLLRWREGARYLPAFLRQKVPSMVRILQPGLRQAWEASQLPLTVVGSIPERQITDLLHFSLPSLLRYEDRNSMAWSIESRVPFLDYRLVEWMVSAPAEVKLCGGRTKAVLRHAMRGCVPDPIVDRRDKMGFVTAQEVWMRHALRPAIESCLSDPDSPLAIFVEPAVLLGEYRRWLANDAVALPQQEFFRLFVLARWLRCFGVNG